MNRVIWLLDSARADATPLCREHADRLTVPDTWRLVDQRDPTTTLWPDESFEVTTDRTSAAGRVISQRRPLGEWAQPKRTRVASASQPSLFDNADGSTLDRSDAATDGESTAYERSAASIGPVPVGPGEHNPLLEVTSPLLSRAFRGVRLAASNS